MSEIDVEFRSSSLQAYELCPRMFGANWLLSNKMAFDFCPELQPVGQNVGAVVGSSVHEAHAYLMNALSKTGDHGGGRRQISALQVARSKLEELWRSGSVGTDSTTPTHHHAHEAVSKITRQMHVDHRPDSEPVLVEKGFEAIYRYKLARVLRTVKVTGTIDLYLLNRRLPDLKTGRNRPAPFSQLGTYDNILEENGIPVDTLEARYYRRVASHAMQPEAEVIPIPRAEAKEHAKIVAVHAHRDITRMLKSGNENQLLARPQHHLCDPRFCPAFGTKFCTIGAVTNPQRGMRHA